MAVRGGGRDRDRDRNRGRIRIRFFAVLALVVLAGCTVPGGLDEFDTDRELGSIGDYAHDDEFDFDESATLTESQLEDVTYRSMARIELLRGLKFEHDVELEVISREEYREQRSGSSPASAFENELWRGAFVVDGETDVNEARDQLYGGAVQGYYVNDRIVLVTDDADADEFRIDRGTLVHELVHALQDQHFGLTRQGQTLDAQRAETALIEGEANYIPHLYDQRCGAEWRCLTDLGEPAMDSDDGADGADGADDAGADRDADATDSNAAADDSSVDEQPFNIGLFLSIYAPYSEGPAFVEAVRERDGWAGVDRAYDHRPASTSQLIHPDRYPDDGPVDVEVPDRSSDAWDPATVDGGEGEEPRTETVGEATLFAMLWSNGVVERPIGQGGTDLSPYNYSAPATNAWAGDTFQVYHDAEDADRTGHVWKLAWETEDDAETFAEAYRTLLTNRGAKVVDAPADGDVYRIPDDEAFAGAYRVAVSDETVEIVGAPTVEDVEEIHGTNSAGTAALDPVSTPVAGSQSAGPTPHSDGSATPQSASASTSLPG